MADGGVMREFLMRLGYQVDAASEAKFKAAAKESSALMEGLGRAATTAALATAAAVTKMASDLNSLFNRSKLAGSSAENFRAFGYAVKQAGGSAEAAQASISALASKMRESPEWARKLEEMGVRTTDAFGNARDNAEIMLDLGDKLAAMPMSRAMAEANAFGLDETTMVALRSGEVRKWFDDAIASQKQLGVSIDESARKARAFWQELNRLWEDFGALALKSAADIAEKLTPAIKWAHEALHKLSEEFDKLDPELKEAITNAAAVGAAFLAAAGILGGVKVVGAVTGLTALFGGLTAAVGATLAAFGGFSVGKWIADKTGLTGKFGKTKFAQMPSANGGQYEAHHAARQKREETAAALFENLESQYGLPRGLLDAVWAQESSRGKNMRSPKGAEGHFQFMPATAKDYGLKNPYDIKESATASARMYRDLLTKYNGDLPKALAAYNWGQGRVDRRGMDAAMLIPETRGYVHGVMGRMGGGKPSTVTQVNNFNIASVDPREAAQEVQRAMGPTSSIMRDLSVAAR